MVKVLPSKISVLPTFQFHVLTTFTIHITFLNFFKGLTYRRHPWKHLRRSENSIENNVLSMLYGLKKHILPYIYILLILFLYYFEHVFIYWKCIRLQDLFWFDCIIIQVAEGIFISTCESFDGYCCKIFFYWMNCLLSCLTCFLSNT